MSAVCARVSCEKCLGATVEDVKLMRSHVAEHVLVKAAGSIRTVDDFLGMVTVGADRIGCSAGIKIIEELKVLPTGIIQIDGKRVYAMVQEATTRTSDTAHFELHRKYMDLQFDLIGAESCLITAGPTTPVGEFDVTGDKGYVDAVEDVTKGTSFDSAPCHGVDVSSSAPNSSNAGGLNTATNTSFGNKPLRVDLADGKFVVFLVGEPHMPTLVCEGKQSAPIKKVCMKLIANEFWDQV